MKKEFTHKELFENKGCYSKKQAEEFYKDRSESVSIKEILESEINIKDKRWFVYNACQLSLDENKKLTLKLAWVVLPIYESKYPDDNRVKECLQAVEDFYLSKITLEELRVKRNAAYAAATYATAAAATAADAAYADVATAYAAYADVATAYAAYATAAATTYAADVATAAATAADADVAYAKINSTYTQRIQECLIDFFN